MPVGGLASGWRIARIFGISIRLHASWVFILALLVFSLGRDYLPLSNLADGGPWWDGIDVSNQVGAYMRSHPLVSEVQACRTYGIELWPEWHYWVLAVIGACGLFVCVLAHELSHSIVAQDAGIPVEGITLFFFGGVARLRDEARTPGVEFRVAAAGPLMSLALSAPCLGMYWGWGSLLPAQARALLFYFFFINAGLLGFNLLPGFPLDGGRLLRAVLWRVLGDLRRATAIASGFGKAFGAGLIGMGLWMWVEEFRQGVVGFGPLWLVIMGLFLWGAAKVAYQQVALREALAGLTVRDALQPGPVVAVGADLTLQALADAYFMRYRYRSFPVVDGDRLAGLVSLKDVQAVPRGAWPFRLVGEIVRPLREEDVARPDEDLAAVMRKMVEASRDQLPVVDGSRLAGVITRRDMMALVQIRSDLGGRQAPGVR